MASSGYGVDNHQEYLAPAFYTTLSILPTPTSSVRWKRRAVASTSRKCAGGTGGYSASAWCGKADSSYAVVKVLCKPDARLLTGANVILLVCLSVRLASYAEFFYGKRFYLANLLGELYVYRG